MKTMPLFLAILATTVLSVGCAYSHNYYPDVTSCSAAINFAGFSAVGHGYNSSHARATDDAIDSACWQACRTSITPDACRQLCRHGNQTSVQDVACVYHETNVVDPD